MFEPAFSDNSYGFRPGRSAQQAIKKAKTYYDEGYTQVSSPMIKCRKTPNKKCRFLARMDSM
jgi:retron-type reverse transcriptase